MPTLGWDRAYRSGDLVRFDGEGLVFVGPRRRPGQARRPAHRARRDRQRAARAARGAAARRPPCAAAAAGNQLLVGYVTHRAPASTPTAAVERLREPMPAALVPRLAVVDDLPTRPPARSTATRCPGRCRTPAAPAPAAPVARRHGRRGSPSTVARRPRRARSSGADDDFFDLGGGSLTAAQLVSPAARAVPRGHRRRRLRAPRPSATWPRRSTTMAAPAGRHEPPGPPDAARRPRSARCVVHASRCAPLGGLRWLTWVGGRRQPRRPRLLGLDLAARPSRWWWVLLGWLLLVCPPGRMLLGAAGRPAPARRRRARRPTRAAARSTCGSGSPSGSPTSSAPPTSPARRWMQVYARLLGARSARHVDLHTLPPVTGHAHARRRLLGRARGRPRAATGSTATCCTSARSGSAPDARVGARSTLLPGRRRRRRAPRSRPGRRCSARSRRASPGPARRPSGLGAARGPWSPSARPRAGPAGSLAYAASAVVHRARCRSSPCSPGSRRAAPARSATPTASATRRAPRSRCCRSRPCVALVVLAAAGARCSCGCSRSGSSAGHHPVHSRRALAGVGDAPGARRGAHLALPALRQRAHPGVAARRSGAGSARTSRPRPCC